VLKSKCNCRECSKRIRYNKIQMHLVSLLLVILLTFCLCDLVLASRSSGNTTLDPRGLLEETRELFLHGFDNYMQHAFPKDELAPLSCMGRNTLGPYALTLVDALDMLHLIDRHRFEAAVEWVVNHVTFNMAAKVSVFETNIRVLGAMLSAYFLTESRLNKRKLLELSVDLANRLLPAFDTPTGICYNEIYLIKGVADSEGQVTCPAAAGTLLLEFGTLSHLTGNCSYLAFARRSLDGVWRHRSFHNLLGTIINVQTGQWTHVESNIGASIDSFYEYLLKSYVMFRDHRLYDRWLTAMKAATKYMSHNSWFLTIRFDNADLFNEPNINSLQAFWPAMLVLGGDVASAVAAFQIFFCVHERFGFLPEVCLLENFFRKQPQMHSSLGYPLRPEYVESIYFLYQATKDVKYVHMAKNILSRLQKSARVPCGIAAIKNVQTGQLEDKMDSFILSETLKYLYLIFREAQGMNSNPWGFPHGVIYTTEAHPLPLSVEVGDTYLKCEYDENEKHIFGVHLSAPRDELRAARNGKDLELFPLFEFHPQQYFERRKQCQRINPWQSQPTREDQACSTTEDGIQKDRMRKSSRRKIEEGIRKQQATEDDSVKELVSSFTLPRNPRRSQSKPLTVRIPNTVGGKKVDVKEISGGVSLTNLSPEKLFDQGTVNFGIAWGDSDSLNTKVYFVNNATFGPSLRTFSEIHFEVLVETPQGFGCQPYALSSHKHIKGKAIPIVRGSCTFQKKILHAQEAGAGLAIIINEGNMDRVQMGPDDELREFPITIPSVLVSYHTWEEITSLQSSSSVVYFKVNQVQDAFEQFGALGFKVDQSLYSGQTRIVLNDMAHSLEIEDERSIWSQAQPSVTKLPQERTSFGGRLILTRATSLVLTASSLPKSIATHPTPLRDTQKIVAVHAKGLCTIEINVVTYCDQGRSDTIEKVCEVRNLEKVLDTSIYTTDEAVLAGRITLEGESSNDETGYITVMRLEERENVHKSRIHNAATGLLRAFVLDTTLRVREVLIAEISESHEWLLVVFWHTQKDAEKLDKAFLDTASISPLVVNWAKFFVYFQNPKVEGLYEVIQYVKAWR